jgi:hypothetical protein
MTHREDLYANGRYRPIIIYPEGIYDDTTLCDWLGVSLQVLGRARKSGELRFSRKGSRNLYMGSWVLRWIEEGSVSREAETPGAGQEDD